jgi:hypothetical protein
MIRSKVKDVKTNHIRPWYHPDRVLIGFQVVCKAHFTGSIAEHGSSYRYRLGCRCYECRRWRRDAERVWDKAHGNKERKTRRYFEENPLPEFYPFIPKGLDVIADSIDGMELLIEVNKSVPKEIPEYAREDICQELLVAILSGEIERNLLADRAIIKGFISKTFKSISTWDLSLDAPLYGDDDRTLLDIIPEV